ncbi:hypothetical protein C0993_001548, partial [Termitomyces sp. T159_Od127]
MVTLTVDPNTEVIPDFTTEDFRFTREAVLVGREGGTNELAVEILTNAWNAGLERRKIIWEEEREEREANRGREDRRVTRERAADEETLQTRQSRAQSPRSSDTPNLVAGKPVPEAIEYPPVCFAIKKLVEQEYIELSYFTPEGREEAVRSESVASQEIFTLAKDDDVLALKPVVNFRAKGKAAQDEDLTWEQLCVASTNFLEHIVIEKWPVNMIEAMHAFFFHLTNHKLCNEGADGIK